MFNLEPKYAIFMISKEKSDEYIAWFRAAARKERERLALDAEDARAAAEIMAHGLPIRIDERLITQHHDEDVTMDWPALGKIIGGWCLPEQDASDLMHHLRRIFGDNPDSPVKAKEWLGAYQEPLHGAPEDLAHGRLKDVPQEIGLPRVISYLKHGRDA